MKITYLSNAQANIVIKTRNEHCEPHVHMYNVQQNWEFKVFFSFISLTAPSIVGKFFKVIAGKPSKRQVEEVINEVYLNLDTYRRAWWSVVGKVCLSNQYVVLVDGFLKEAMPATRGAVRIHSASYNPSTAEIQFDFFSTWVAGNENFRIRKMSGPGELMERVKLSDEEYEQALAESESRPRPPWSLASVRYDRRRNRLIMGLEKGIEFSLPLALVSELAGAAPDVLAQMVLTPSGEVLVVDEINAHIGTKGLIEAALSVLPARAFAATLGATGGARSTNAKRSAAAENGKKGGRPPKGKSEQSDPGV